MERQINRLFVVFVVLFLALVAQLTYIQVYRASSLDVHPQNTRALDAQMRIQRGRIVSSDGVVLADVVSKDPYFARRYAAANLVSPWIGYADLRYGKAGVERVYNKELSGESDLLAVRNLIDRLTGKDRRGADLTVTIDTRIQKAAADALGSRVGAVVAVDPKTGDVLAMVSYPTFDPQQVGQDWKSLNADPKRPLVNRATQGLYPPGSTFKVVTAGAGLETGAVTPQTAFVDDGSWVAGGYKVGNFGGASYGKHTFAEAFFKSVNTTFAKVGVDVGAQTLAEFAKKAGFDSPIPWPLGGAVSLFPDPDKMDEAHVAQAAFGQGQVLATPLQMALVAAGVADSGQIMIPNLVKEWRDYHGIVLSRPSPKVWRTSISPATAATLRDLMVQVVESGTGTAAAIPGVKVAGKTGTAETATGDTHAWFIGFAPADDPKIAVAVLVEHGGTGGATAAPIAKATMSAALGR